MSSWCRRRVLARAERERCSEATAHGERSGINVYCAVIPVSGPRALGCAPAKERAKARPTARPTARKPSAKVRGAGGAMGTAAALSATIYQKCIVARPARPYWGHSPASRVPSLRSMPDEDFLWHSMDGQDVSVRVGVCV